MHPISRPRAGTLTTAALLACAAGACVLPATASSRSAFFTGRCEMQGSMTFDKGVTFKTAEHDGAATASGVCSGGERTTLAMKFHGPVSCTGSTRPATGTGTLTSHGNEFPVTVDFDIKLPQGTLGLSDGHQGALRGAVSFIEASNVMGMMRCPGAGLDRAKFRLTLLTKSPLELKDGGAGTAPAGASVKVSVAGRQGRRATRSRGYVPVRCTPATASRCSVRVTRGSTVLASGSARAGAGKGVTVKARLTRAGRRALRRKGTVKALVHVAGGGATATRTITFR